MIQSVAKMAPQHEIEKSLRADLARGDAMAETVTPILRHLLVSGGHDLFNEDIVARVRGMAEDLATQLLEKPVAQSIPDDEAVVKRLGRGSVGPAEALAVALLDRPALLAHLHATAIEWRLTERLEARTAIDPVMSPLLQSLMQSQSHSISELATRFLSAQARFCQSQRRMKLPIADLTPSLAGEAISALRVLAGSGFGSDIQIARLEGEILTRLVHDLGREELAARLLLAVGTTENSGSLSIVQAGVALFLTALTIGSGEPRDVLTMATHECQSARLILAMRAAGLDSQSIGEQFRILHPTKAPPRGFSDLDPEMALELLGDARRDIRPPES